MSKTYIETHGDYSAEVHLFPFRTEKLSPAAPMILHESCGKVGRRHPHNGSLSIELGLFCFVIVSRSSEPLLSPHAFFRPADLTDGHGSSVSWVTICDIFPSLSISCFEDYFIVLFYNRSMLFNSWRLPASGIGAASFCSAAEKDTAESPTAQAGTPYFLKLIVYSW